MKILFGLLYWMCLPAFVLASAENIDSTGPVRVETGLLQGVTSPDKKVVSFKGIPYAAPPVGDLRWREPMPPLKWEGVRKAENFGAISPQLEFGTKNPAPESSEDCLFLNIWAPANSGGKKLPILFFVHGGMYQFGSGNMNGEGMAQKGVIFISVNCRLGMFNSFGHPLLTKESPLKSSGNYGSLDLIAALKWIHRNIGAFGGDPNQITISGQSTGSNNVHYLTTSPMAKGLFRGLIAISFPYDFLMKQQAIGNQNQIEQNGLAFAKKRNINTLDELRKVPAAELTGGGGPAYGSPIYPVNYPTALKNGLVSDVPTMTGMTLDDFFDPGYYTDIAFYKKRVTRQWPDKAEKIFEKYPAKTNSEAVVMWKRLLNEQKLAQIFLWAKQRATTAKSPVFTYMFTHVQPLEPKKGAYHGSDMFYSFNDVWDKNKPWRDADLKVAGIFSSYVVNFVKNGNPNGPGLPNWEAFDPNNPSTMYINENPKFDTISPDKETWNMLHSDMSK